MGSSGDGLVERLVGVIGFPLVGEDGSLVVVAQAACLGSSAAVFVALGGAGVNFSLLQQGQGETGVIVGQGLGSGRSKGQRLGKGGFAFGVFLVEVVGVAERSVDDVVGLVLGDGLLHGGDGGVILLVFFLLGGLLEQGVDGVDLFVFLY